MKYYKMVFSPTGGTKKVADAITKSWADVIEIDLTDKSLDFSQWQFANDDLVLIAMPSYGGLAPQIALDRLACVSGGGAKCAVVAVYGNRAYEDTLVQMYDAATKCGFKVIAAISAVAEHSIVRKYAAGRPNSNDCIELDEFGKQILKKENDDAPAIPGNRPYKKAGSVGMIPTANSSCTACGLCVKQCPVGAISETDIKTADKTKCISCMRCVSECPQHARLVSSVMLSMASLMLKKVCGVAKKNELFI